MSYEDALTKAGAEVHAFRCFGSYQGDWYAKVTYKGQRGWVSGSFGSCSHCDAFEAEFGWDDDELPDYPERLAAFGSKYLDYIKDDDAIIESAAEYSEWDLDAEEAVKWLKENRWEH